MARYSLIKNNFSSGELSPLLSTRTDVAQYSNGARKLLNVIPLIEGGVKKRPGTYYRGVFEGALRLIPFVSTSANAYLLIIKAQSIVVYNPKTKQITTILNTPYDANAIPDLHYVHTRYVMYFTHQDYPVQLLECSEDFTNWNFRAMSFDVPPIDEVISTPNVALKPSGKDAGATISLTATNYPDWASTIQYFQGERVIHSNKTWRAVNDNINSEPTSSNTNWTEVTGTDANVFNAGHIGAIISINGGNVRITQFISASQVKGEVVNELTAGVQAIAKSWTLKTSDKYVHEDGQFYSDDEIRDLLIYSFNSITSNGANKLEIGRNNFGGNSKVTSRHNESRVLHFKDADTWMDYQEKYGGLQFVDLVEAHITGLSKDIALVEDLGSNPKGAMKILMDAAKQKDWEKGVEINKTESGLKRSQVMFDEFMGANQPENAVLANVGLTYRSINVSSMLGGTLLSSGTDQAMVYKTAQIHGISYRKIFGEMLTQLNPKNKADRELARSLGLATEEMLGSIARWSDDGLTSVHGKAEMAAKFSSSLATQVLRISGLNAYTAANKIAFSKILMDKYGRMTRDKSWSDLAPIDRELLEGTGLNERTWEVMKLAEPVNDGRGNQLMSARSIYEIPDNLLTKFGDPKKVRDEAATRFQAHILDEQGMAVIEAGLREKTWLTGSLKKGSVMGEILRSMLQFKSFPAALLMKHGSRTFSRPTLKSRAVYLGSLVALTSLLGGLILQLKEISAGNDPLTMWDSDDPQKTIDFMKRSVAQGGGLAIMGDIVVAGMDPTGRGVDGVLTGPFGQDVKSILSLTVGNATQLANGVETNAGNEAFKFLKGKIPAQNLWYTKAVANRMLFDELQDTIAPGYREKVMRKAEKQYGRSQWLGDDWGDIQAPDFDKVIQ